ncbi:MAG: membrane protein insertion efficiency factor YidD [Winogradskyella sp.]|jgi:hypothetical protein|nr:membrane protein insertion efficiency factor YidD [Winogradskyella sp.]
MSYVLIAIIKFYWFLKPVSLKPRCIYHESCSNYVYRITLHKGFKFGLKALIKRYHSCRSGYYLFKIKDKWCLKTVNNLYIYQTGIARHILLDLEKNNAH